MTAADGWTETTLGDLIEVKHGFAFKGEYFRDKPPGDVLLTPGNFAIGGGFKADKLKYYVGPVPEEFVLDEGELIISMTDLSKRADTLGYPALVPKSRAGRFLHNQRLGRVVVHPDAPISKEYLFYLLCTREYRHEVVSTASGTTVKHTSPTRARRFRFWLPSLDEQRAIAHILGTLDDKIELNRKTNQTLEAIAQAIFKSWFVDFDPVRARAEGREPEGMNAETAALFPSGFEDSELGQIPRGWQAGVLGDLIDIHDSKRIPLSKREREQRKGPYPYHGATSVVDYVDDYLFDGVYVLVGEDGSVVTDEGYPFVQYVWGKLWVNNYAHVLTARRGATQEQLYLLLTRLNIGAFVTGAVQAKLSQTNMKKTPTVVAPEPVSSRFGSYVQDLFERYRQNVEENRTLAALRDTLLPRLLTGEIRIADAERLLGEAV